MSGTPTTIGMVIAGVIALTWMTVGFGAGYLRRGSNRRWCPHWPSSRKPSGCS